MPSEKPCPPGKVRNPKTGRCIMEKKPCPPGKVRNPKTGRCITEKKSPTEEKPCPPGKVRNPKTGRCITEKKPPTKEQKDIPNDVLNNIFLKTAKMCTDEKNATGLKHLAQACKLAREGAKEVHDKSSHINLLKLPTQPMPFEQFIETQKHQFDTLYIKLIRTLYDLKFSDDLTIVYNMYTPNISAVIHGYQVNVQLKLNFEIRAYNKTHHYIADHFIMEDCMTVTKNGKLMMKGLMNAYAKGIDHQHEYYDRSTGIMHKWLFDENRKFTLVQFDQLVRQNKLHIQFEDMFWMIKEGRKRLSPPTLLDKKIKEERFGDFRERWRDDYFTDDDFKKVKVKTIKKLTETEMKARQLKLLKKYDDKNFLYIDSQNDKGEYYRDNKNIDTNYEELKRWFNHEYEIYNQRHEINEYVVYDIDHPLHTKQRTVFEDIYRFYHENVNKLLDNFIITWQDFETPKNFRKAFVSALKN